MRREMQARPLVALVATLWSLSAFAQEVDEDPIARSRRIIDEATAQIMTRPKPAADGRAPVRMGPTVDELKKLRGVDPMQIAQRYREAGVGQPKATRMLLVFVSTSMPEKALKMLGVQAKQAGAVMVLRGLKGPIDQPGVLAETAKALRTVAEAGADIQIDPKAFKRYNVTAVPTFVLADAEEGCADEVCSAEAHRLVGDTTLAYALDHWIAGGGRAATVAASYRQRIEGY